MTKQHLLLAIDISSDNQIGSIFDGEDNRYNDTVRQRYQQNLTNHKSRLKLAWRMLWGTASLLLALLIFMGVTRTRGAVWGWIIGGMIILIIVSIAILQWSGVEASKAEQVLENLRHSNAGRIRLQECMNANKPFVLYLRDFAPERKFWNQHGGILNMFMTSKQEILETHLYGEYRGASFRLERDLLEPIASHLPVFALLNSGDLNPSPIACRIGCADERWFNVFARMATVSSLIVFNISTITSNVLRELEWISESESGGRTLLMISRRARHALGRKCPTIEERLRWVVHRPHLGSEHAALDKPSRKMRLPEDFIKYLVGVSNHIDFGLCPKSGPPKV